jgi:hypothetical protein
MISAEELRKFKLELTEDNFIERVLFAIEGCARVGTDKFELKFSYPPGGLYELIAIVKRKGFLTDVSSQRLVISW